MYVYIYICMYIYIYVYTHRGKRRRMRVTRITRKSFAFGTFVVVMNSDICGVKNGWKVGGGGPVAPVGSIQIYYTSVVCVLKYIHSTYTPLYYTHSTSLHTLYY